MRFKITFQLEGASQLLPINYKYPISSWIYKTLGAADKEFTTLLHEQGYQLDSGKKFKLFTFSDLQIPKGKWKIIGDRIKIWPTKISMVIAFMLPEQIQTFVAGLFMNQQVTIGDEITQIKLQVQNIEAVQNIKVESEIVCLKWMSPLFLAETNDNEKYPKYISPIHPKYGELFINNLKDKYMAYCNVIGKEPIAIDSSCISFKSLHDKPKSTKQTIKAFKKEQTDIRAFKFNFELTAPAELIEIGLNAGFGAANAMGFGCCELVDKSLITAGSEL